MTDHVPATNSPEGPAPSPHARGQLSGVEALPGGDAPSIKAKRLMRRYVWGAFGFSVVVNLLFLVTPLYMLQIYDRILSSGSIPTLIVLTSIAVFLLLIYIAADGGRRRVLARSGQLLGEALDGLVMKKGLGVAGRASSETITAVTNLSRIQGLLLQAVISPLFDLIFVPIFLGILWIIDYRLGAFATAGAVILLITALLTDRISRRSVEDAGARDQKAQRHMNHLVRQRAAIVSMGMTDRAVGTWQNLRRDAVDATLDAGTLPTFLSSAARSLRLILQVGILGLGAALAVFGEVTPGTVIAASIIMGRGLAPIDQTVGVWRQMALGRKSWRDLIAWIDQDEDQDAAETDTPTAMPRPTAVLKFEDFSVGIPGSKKALLPPMNIELEPGTIIALLGASGAGKTSFLQSVAGAWPAHQGAVRLGGRNLATWDPRDRGRFIGYLPQDVELLTGTVFENICRFSDAQPEDVYHVTKLAGCHEMILTLPKGYDTPVGEGGTHLSAGQRQSIGLSRAFFGDPALLLLDEPTAHLDATLTANLMTRFANVARLAPGDRGITAIIATHDLRLINAADTVMLIKDRKIILTPREEYLRKVSDLRRPSAAMAAGGQRPGGTIDQQSTD